MLVLTCKDGEFLTITVPPGEAQVFTIHVRAPSDIRLAFDAPRVVDVKLHRRAKDVGNAPLGKRRAPR